MIPTTSRYDDLDPRTSLEQTISKELERGLQKRGFKILHCGSNTFCAPGDKPDIVIHDLRLHINVEVTKTVKSGANREFLAIKQHLLDAKKIILKRNVSQSTCLQRRIIG